MPGPHYMLKALMKQLRREELGIQKQIVEDEAERFVIVGEHRIPARPYNGWRFVELLPFNHLYEVYHNHHRLEVFAKKGLKCVHPECDKRAVHLIVTVDHNGARHVDVVDKDFKLMNVDHIYPRSKGGPDTLENKQPMCVRHNSKKGSKLVPY